MTTTNNEPSHMQQTRDVATLPGKDPKHETPGDDQNDDAIHPDKEGDVESLQLGRKVTIVDPVFGEIEEGGPNYRNVSPLMRMVCVSTVDGASLGRLDRHGRHYDEDANRYWSSVHSWRF